MKYVMCLLLLLIPAAVSAEAGSVMSLPKIEDVFVIASSPLFAGKRPYFTPESLLKALPQMRLGEAELKAGARRVWQSGVIVLKDKKVLFWTSCRSNFIHILTDSGSTSFIIGDGRDDL